MSVSACGRRGHGFTLIELLIVVAIIAVLSAVAVPNLLASRVTSNESAAISTLRTLISAQAAARQMVAVDGDQDGLGEYGYFAELAGSKPIRGGAVILTPPALSPKMGRVSQGTVTESGYLFRMFLPGNGGTPVAEDPNGGIADPTPLNANLCEFFWVCYAWPTDHESSGNRTFVAAYPGGIMMTDNDAQQYSGLAGAPRGDAVFTIPGDITSHLSVRGQPGPANDGGLWIPMN